MSRLQPLHRYIYVIGPETGLQKVGLATDPRSRLATLQPACPLDLLLHFTVAMPFGEAHNIERRAHRILARSCVRNEWFETTSAEAIAAVRSAAAPKPAKPTAPPEWRNGRPHRQPVLAVEPAPLMRFGRRQPEQLAPINLPLFDFQFKVRHG